jgi:hypothetical protein
LTLRQDQHLGREIGDAGAAGEEAKQLERVAIEIARSGARLGPTGAAGDIGAEHVVWCGDPVIADRLSRLDRFPQGCRGATDVDDRKGHAELHLHLRWSSRLCVSA